MTWHYDKLDVDDIITDHGLITVSLPLANNHKLPFSVHATPFPRLDIGPLDNYLTAESLISYYKLNVFDTLNRLLHCANHSLSRSTQYSDCLVVIDEIYDTFIESLETLAKTHLSIYDPEQIKQKLRAHQP